METLQQIYERHKHPSSIAFGDKESHHSYIEAYEALLSKYRNTAENVLEVRYRVVILFECGMNILMGQRFMA